MITIVQWPNHTILLVKFILVVELWVLLSSLQSPLLERSLQLSNGFIATNTIWPPASCNQLHRGYQECGCPSNLNNLNNLNNLWLLCEWPTKYLPTPSWSLSFSDQSVQFLCWNSPWWWRYKHFCLAVAAIARALSPSSGGSTVLRKATRRFWPHSRDRYRSLTLTCQNSPYWLSCECCLVFLSLVAIARDRLSHVACALIGTNCNN